MNNILNIKLPEINKDLDIEVFNYRNKYRTLYLNLIKKAKSLSEQELSGYTEKHHIIPKCMGGDDEDSNIVTIPYRYHLIAHLILVRVFPDNAKLNYSIWLMLQKDKSSKFSTRFLTKQKELSMVMRSGENHPVFGKYKTTEEKEIIKNKYRGSNNIMARKVLDPQGNIYGSIKEAAKINKLPYDTLAKWLSGETKNNHGWTYLSGDKTDFSNRNNEKSSKKVINSEGKVYKSITEACKLNNIPFTTMRYWLSGRVKNNHGWSFIN